MIRNAWWGIKQGFSLACCDINMYFFLYNADSFSVMLGEGFLLANIFPSLTFFICIYFSCYFLHAASQDFLTRFIKATMNLLPTFKLLHQWLSNFLHLNDDCLPSKPPSSPSVSVNTPAFLWLQLPQCSSNSLQMFALRNLLSFPADCNFYLLLSEAGMHNFFRETLQH